MDTQLPALGIALQDLLDAPLATALATLGHTAPLPAAPADIASIRTLLAHPTPPLELLDVLFLASQQSTTVSRSVADVLQLAALSIAINRCAFEVPPDEQPMFRDLFDVAMRLEWVDETTKEILDDGLTALTQGTTKPIAPAPASTPDTAAPAVDAKPHRRRRRMNFRSAIAALIMVGVLSAAGIYYHQQTTIGDGPRYEGWIESTQNQKVTGWAWDSARPGQPVEVVLSDGVHPPVTVLADQNRDDLHFIGEGHANHGFVYQIPAELRDGKSYTLTATIAGTDCALNASPATVAFEK